VSDDTNGNTDIFLKDTTTNQTTRVSATSSSAQSSGGNSTNPAISSDGRFVAFTSTATNLVGSDSNGVADIFVKDTIAGTITRLSTDTSGTQANGASDNAAIASNGKYAVYDSAATNLITGDTNSLTDVFKAKVDTKAPSSLAVSSTTHPSSSKYYKTADVVLSWSAADASGVAGYSYAMDKSSKTKPDTTSEGVTATKSYTTHSNGAYYFHLRAVDVHSNWSSTKRFKVNIDRTRPKTYARKKHVVRRRRRVASARFYWRVADSYTGNKAYVKILIRKRVIKKIGKKRKAVYRLVKVANYRWTRINQVRYYGLRLRTGGIYRYSVFSRDQAGNTQRNVAAGYVIVK